MRVNFSPRVLISRTAISPRRAARNDRARRLDGCFVFLERVAFAFPHFPTTRRAATRPSSSLSSSGGQRAKRQKRQAGETNLSHFVSFAPSLAGRMISHLFRRLISRPPALSPFSLSLSLSLSLISLSCSLPRLVGAGSLRPSLRPEQKSTPPSRTILRASSLSINRGVD